MAVITDELLGNFPDEVREYDDFYSKIVGTTFAVKERKVDFTKVQEGDFVLLQAEIGNQYDDHAVMIIHNVSEQHLGYLPKETAYDVWENITKKGHLYVGRISEVTGKDKENQGYNLLVRHIWRKDS